MTAEEAITYFNDAIIDYRSVEDWVKVQEIINMATEALEKAEKYKWHDLRKNPDDFPEFGKQIMAYGLNFHNVLCKYEEFTNHRGDIEKCFVRFDAWSGNEKLKNVISWRYIEPFEGENDSGRTVICIQRT